MVNGVHARFEFAVFEKLWGEPFKHCSVWLPYAIHYNMKVEGSFVVKGTWFWYRLHAAVQRVNRDFEVRFCLEGELRLELEAREVETRELLQARTCSLPDLLWLLRSPSL